MQVTRSEFVLLWGTYLAIMYAGLEAGIGAGIVFATLYFAFVYARVRRPAQCCLLGPDSPPVGPLMQCIMTWKGSRMLCNIKAHAQAKERMLSWLPRITTATFVSFPAYMTAIKMLDASMLKYLHLPALLPAAHHQNCGLTSTLIHAHVRALMHAHAGMCRCMCKHSPLCRAAAGSFAR